MQILLAIPWQWFKGKKNGSEESNKVAPATVQARNNDSQSRAEMERNSRLQTCWSPWTRWDGGPSAPGLCPQPAVYSLALHPGCTTPHKPPSPLQNKNGETQVWGANDVKSPSFPSGLVSSSQTSTSFLLLKHGPSDHWLVLIWYITTMRCYVNCKQTLDSEVFLLWTRCSHQGLQACLSSASVVTVVRVNEQVSAHRDPRRMMGRQWASRWYYFPLPGEECVGMKVADFLPNPGELRRQSHFNAADPQKTPMRERWAGWPHLPAHCPRWGASQTATTGLLSPASILSHPPGLTVIFLTHRNPFSKTATGRIEFFGFLKPGLERLKDGDGGGCSFSTLSATLSLTCSLFLNLLKRNPQLEQQNGVPSGESVCVGGGAQETAFICFVASTDWPRNPKGRWLEG